MKTISEEKDKTILGKSTLRNQLFKTLRSHGHQDPIELQKAVEDIAARDLLTYPTFVQILTGLDLEIKEAQDYFSMIMEEYQKLKKLDSSIYVQSAALQVVLKHEKNSYTPVAINSAKLDQLQTAVITDELTGLYNRRYLEQVIERELVRSQRYAIPCSMIFLDLDHFKKINDQYGHFTGDEVLEEVSSQIAQSLRSFDLPCRYGGEEFAILAPQTDKSGAMEVAERIRKKVEQLEFPGIPEVITISGGVATFPQDANSASELIKKADQALYLAKTRGRNQISQYQHYGDQRKQHRYPIEMNGKLLYRKDQHKKFKTQNLSRKGLKIETDSPLSLGSIIEIEVSVANSLPIRGVASVVHLTERRDLGVFELGISIVHMEVHDEVRYIAMIEEQNA